MNGVNQQEEGAAFNGGFDMEKTTETSHQVTILDPKFKNQMQLPQHYTSQSGIISEQGASSTQNIFKISRIAMIKSILISNYHYFLHLLAIVYFIFATRHYTSMSRVRSIMTSETNTDSRHFRKHDAPEECGLQFCNGYGFLLLLFVGFYVWFLITRLFQPLFGESLHRICSRISRKISEEVCNCSTGCRSFGLVLLLAVPTILLATFLYFECRDEPRKLIGLLAPVLSILGGYTFSTHRSAIKWRVVVPGIASQWILGLLCLRWEVGRSIFQCLGQKVAQFAAFTDLGSRFVFGNDLVDHGYFAFSSLPMIFFFSFIVALLYHWNVMQSIIGRMGGILQTLLGTTVCESVNAAANVFLGQTESPLLIRPYLNSLTASELHAVMVSGFATVSGTVLAAYLKFGASAAYLITASVMAAPASLAFAKLYCPETEISQTSRNNIKLAKSEYNSSFDAASKGAASAVPVVIGITVNLIVFIAAVALLNAIVNWLGLMVGLDNIDFEWFLSKFFIPFVWLMGVPWVDCESVAKVIAAKTIVNEFVAYEKLGFYISTAAIQPRSITIATFAICSFGNPASIGIIIGTLGALAPQRREAVLNHVFRAFIVSSVVSFVSASFAGILYTDMAELTTQMNTNNSFKNF